MKTQTIVLALALVAVTPAVLSAQDYVGGPGSKMSYIADNTLARIRTNDKENKQQNPVAQKQEQKPVQQQSNAQLYQDDVYSYAYTGREGHMAALGFLFTKPRNNATTQKPKTKPAATTTTTKQKSSNTYNPYVGPEGHRAAIGNAVRDARHDTTPAATPNYVRDLDTVAKNHQVTLDTKQADKSTKKTNGTFRQYLEIVGKAIADEAPYMK